MPYDTNFFYVYRDAALRWRWRLYARNEEILADSGQGFVSKDSCERNVALVKSVVPTAPLRYAPGV